MSEETTIPFDIESDVGEIGESEMLCPGLYYVSAHDPATGLPHEYYIAQKSKAPLTEQAQLYGTPMESGDNLLMFSLEDETGGGTVVRYEVERYRARNGLPPLGDESVLVTAEFGREHYPEYFGDYSVPPMTPCGATTRYKRLAAGVFVLETESFERMIAVCHPVWSCDLSDYALARGKLLDTDAHEGLDNNLAYLFFSEIDGCVALFELWRWYNEFMASGLIDREAMMNAIYLNHPQYAVQHNRREQEGLNDVGAQFWRWLGCDAEPEGREENLIRFNMGKGVKYLLF